MKLFLEWFEEDSRRSRIPLDVLGLPERLRLLERHDPSAVHAVHNFVADKLAKYSTGASE